MRVNKIHIFMFFVLLFLGFLLSYSFLNTKEVNKEKKNDDQWVNMQKLQVRLLDEKEINFKLEEQLQSIQNKVTTIEKQISEQQDAAQQILGELEQVRMSSGLIPVTGPGVVVTLNDSKNASQYEDVTNYIVHEQDVRRVVNELFVAGAEAIGINGQRLTSNSAIRCIGPTIIVNGVKSTIPFEITAIGNPDTLAKALDMPGGVLEMLREWSIEVKLTRSPKLELPAFLGDATMKTTVKKDEEVSAEGEK